MCYNIDYSVYFCTFRMKHFLEFEMASYYVNLPVSRKKSLEIPVIIKAGEWLYVTNVIWL